MKLTIIIPTYNRSRQLSECLDVLVPQVLPYKDEVHIYISDNASTDNTQQLCISYKNRYSEIITYFRQKENILGEPNFNHAVHSVDSEYVYLLGDDDIVAPFFVMFSMYLLKKYANINWFYFNQYVTSDDMLLKFQWNKQFMRDEVVVYDRGADMVKDYLNGPSCISSNIFRREIWMKGEQYVPNVYPGEYPGYVWLAKMYSGCAHLPSAYISYPMFLARSPATGGYSSDWPWYYIVGMGETMALVEKLSHNGVYQHWISYQQKTLLRVCLKTLLPVSYYKDKYKSRREGIKKHLHSKYIRLFLDLCIFVFPKSFSKYIILPMLKCMKIFCKS